MVFKDINNSSIGIFLFLFSFMFFTFNDSLYSQVENNSRAGSLEIASITISGNKLVSTDVIKLSSGLEVGKVIYSEDLQEAIRKLWSLGLFSDIILESENNVNGKLFLKINLEEFPKLKTVKVMGNDEFDKDDLTPSILLLQGQSIKHSDIQMVKNDLKSFYESKNYLLAKISTRMNYVDMNFVELVIEIDEGEEVLIEQIVFHGNEAYDNDELLDTFENTHEDAWWRDGEYNADNFEEDLERLTAFYKNSGYKDFEILRDSISYDENSREMFVDLFVHEGNEYFFGDIKFEGNTIFADIDLQRELQFEKGDVFSKELLDISVQMNLSTLYMDRGYLKHNTRPVEQVVSSDTISYIFKISEGSKSRVRKINILGNTNTSERVIRRELAIHPGDIFNRTKIMRSQRNLMVLNYFETVMPNVAGEVNDNEVDLVFEVKEKPTAQAQTAISYSQTDGFVGSLGLSFPNFSFEKPFSRGDGQKFATNIEFGRDYYKYTLTVEDPRIFDSRTLVGASVNYIKRRDTYSDTYIFGGTLRAGRTFAWSDNYIRGIWAYSLNQIKYENVESNTPDIYELYEGKKIISSSLTQYITRSDIDRVDFPTTGTVLSLMTKLAGTVLQGDEEFHKHKFEIKNYQPIYKDRLVLYTQYLFGVMGKINNDSYISSREYFTLGGGGLSGSEPLRGYEDNSIGILRNGYYTGGKNLFKTSIELRFKIVQDPMLVYMLGFFDAGNVWDGFTESNLFDLRKGAGVGIRMAVPMLGMMGFDVGYGFDHYDSFGKLKPWKLELKTHFRMGQNL